MQDYVLSLKEDEVNLILYILSQRPYMEVVELIDKIRKQALSEQK